MQEVLTRTDLQARPYMGQLPPPPQPATVQYSALPSETTGSDSPVQPRYRGPQTEAERMLRYETYGKSTAQRYYDALYQRGEKRRFLIENCMRDTVASIVFVVFGLALSGVAAIAFYVASFARPDISWLKPIANTISIIVAAVPITLAIWYSVKRSQCSKEASRQVGTKPTKPHKS